MSSSVKMKSPSVLFGSKEYPKALASHEDVVKDPIVFLDTLKRFHFVLGSKFMVPVIGGKELDLHVLYVETTNRGGYEKVVAEKKWREVGSVFMFSSTTTSASFVLKKHYFTLLYHYEQVYFFKVEGPLSSPTAAFSVNDPSPTNEMAPLDFSSKKTSHDKHLHPDEESSCCSAIGTIDGKMECGYLVSVKLGSETLNGVLYHADQPSSSINVPTITSTAIVPYTHTRKRHLRKRRSRRGLDPSYPKTNRSGYNFFFAEQHYKLKSLYSNRERELTKLIGESWNKLSQSDRMVYQNIGLKDKERYKRELKEYKEKLNAKQTTEIA